MTCKASTMLVTIVVHSEFGVITWNKSIVKTLHAWLETKILEENTNKSIPSQQVWTLVKGSTQSLALKHLLTWDHTLLFKFEGRYVHKFKLEIMRTLSQLNLVKIESRNLREDSLRLITVTCDDYWADSQFSHFLRSHINCLRGKNSCHSASTHAIR